METEYEGYNFNEIFKQFEPIDNTCVYCQKNESTLNTNMYLNLYKEKDRINLLVFRSVKYSDFAVSVPRCSNCFEIHYNIKLYSKILTGLSFFLVFPLGFYLIGGVFGMFISIMSSALAAVYIYKIAEKKLLEIKQMDSEEIGAEKVKLVQIFLNDGWTSVPPTA